MMPRSARRPAALTLLLTLALGACGGGGAILPTEAGSGDGVGGGDAGGGDSAGGGGTGGGDNGGGTGGDNGGGGPVPVTVTVIVGETGFSPSSVSVPVGSTVVWQVIDNHHDVTFVSSAPAGGSIGDTEEGESASRTFTVAGTYEYYCDRHDGEELGTVVVTSEGDGGGDNGGGDPPSGTTATVRTVGDTFSPSQVTIAAGGSVQWQISGDDHNVTFTGAAPPGGNVPTTGSGTHTRTFPDAGRYDYFCTRHSGMTGAVTVQ